MLFSDYLLVLKSSLVAIVLQTKYEMPVDGISPEPILFPSVPV
jgi:hypothetical protein